MEFATKKMDWNSEFGESWKSPKTGDMQINTMVIVYLILETDTKLLSKYICVVLGKCLFEHNSQFRQVGIYEKLNKQTKFLVYFVIIYQ